MSATQTTREPAGSTPAGPAPVKAIPVRHYGRYISAAVVLTLAAMLLWSLWINKAIDRATVREFLFSDPILDGLKITLLLTVVSMIIGVVGGVVLAVMRLSKNPVLSWASWVFIWFFRGTPLIVQLLFWGFLGALYPSLGLGIPGTDLQLDFGSTNAIVTPLVAALLGLGFNEAAYAAEVIRAGIVSVDPGQSEAAHSLGMSSGKTMRRIVLPQAMRVIIPPMGNETITMLKSTGLVVVIGGSKDLFTTTQNIYTSNGKIYPLLVVASLWYLLLTSLLSVGQFFLERRFGRGSATSRLPGPLSRMFGGGGRPDPVGAADPPTQAPVAPEVTGR